MSFSSFSYFTFCRTKCASELHFFPHSPPPSSSFLCYLLRLLQHGEEGNANPSFLPPSHAHIASPPTLRAKAVSVQMSSSPYEEGEKKENYASPLLLQRHMHYTGLEKEQNGDFAAHFCESLSERGKWCIFHPFLPRPHPLLFGTLKCLWEFGGRPAIILLFLCQTDFFLQNGGGSRRKRKGCFFPEFVQRDRRSGILCNATPLCHQVLSEYWEGSGGGGGG